MVLIISRHRPGQPELSFIIPIFNLVRLAGLLRTEFVEAIAVLAPINVNLFNEINFMAPDVGYCLTAFVSLSALVMAQFQPRLERDLDRRIID